MISKKKREIEELKPIFGAKINIDRYSIGNLGSTRAGLSVMRMETCRQFPIIKENLILVPFLNFSSEVIYDCVKAYVALWFVSFLVFILYFSCFQLKTVFMFYFLKFRKYIWLTKIFFSLIFFLQNCYIIFKII